MYCVEYTVYVRDNQVEKIHLVTMKRRNERMEDKLTLQEIASIFPNIEHFEQEVTERNGNYEKRYRISVLLREERNEYFSDKNGNV